MSCPQMYQNTVPKSTVRKKQMTKNQVWDKPNPKKKSTKLTPEQKAEAKSRAKAAGRPYPNLVDNMAVSKKGKK